MTKLREYVATIDSELLWVISPCREDFGKPPNEGLTSFLKDIGLVRSGGDGLHGPDGKLSFKSRGIGFVRFRYKLRKATYHCYNCEHAKSVIFDERYMVLGGTAQSTKSEIRYAEVQKHRRFIFCWNGSANNKAVLVTCEEKGETPILMWNKGTNIEKKCWKKRPAHLQWQISEPTPGCIGHNEDITIIVPIKKRVRRKLPTAIQVAVWERDAGKCVQCDSTEELEFDHIIPLSKGGANTISNLQILCSKCNLRKSDNIGGEESQ